MTSKLSALLTDHFLPHRLYSPAMSLVILQFFLFGYRFLLTSSENLKITQKWPFVHLIASTKTFRDLVTGQENWYGLKAYKLGQCIKGDKILVSQGTLTNLEQRVEISVSTGFQKDIFFFFFFFFAFLGG